MYSFRDGLPLIYNHHLYVPGMGFVPAAFCIQIQICTTEPPGRTYLNLGRYTFPITSTTNRNVGLNLISSKNTEIVSLMW